MLISIIAAMSRNRVIGDKGGVPWRLPADVRRFRALTTGHSLIMGRKTFESIGRPLPERINIVVTRQPDYRAEGCLVAPSLEAALLLAEPADEVFICGGTEIYQQALPFAGKLYLTFLEQDFSGDAYFPEIPFREFVEVEREQLSMDPAAVFVVMERRLTASGRAANVRT